MADVIVSIDDDMLEVLKAIAAQRKKAVEDIVRDMVLDDIEAIRRRNDSPLIGMLGKYGSAEKDVASRADDIINDEWLPD